MTADIARITYDPTRQYRSLVFQQGRVTLEADNNEAATLAAEAARLATVDIIGPTGAPGDGFAVSPGAGPDGISVSPGLLYLGGWRLELDQTLTLPPQTPPINSGSFVVALLITEQSVSAVEDQALREVALGGPDSAARTRLMQTILRIPVNGGTCAQGLATVAGLLQQDGVTLDTTLQILSHASLQAGFVPGPVATDACTPAAAGGYLGADNQMIRVTVTDFNPATNTGTLLWGWNNAALLYRASVTDARTLTLLNTPVDQEHAPQQSQMVEILMTEMDLGGGNLVAAPEGFVTSLTQGYSFDLQQIGLTDALPADYAAASSPLFVRVWQSSVPFTAGVPTALDRTSGLTVTIALPVLPSQIAARPFWHFSVRPGTPQNIYPQRYADAPQPPDGPRQWITDLAMIQAGSPPSVLADCRVPFLPLTELASSECCHLVLDPAKDWVGQLNAALAGPATSLSVCLQPGVFAVTSPIRISGKSVRITGAGFSSQLVGTALEVVLECDSCPEVVLSDLAVQAGASGTSHSGGTAGLQGATTLRGCNQVDIERVLMSCADADLRSASCLAVYNPVPSANQMPLTYNVRVRDSRFNVGHCQVGILLVNADRAQIEGNLVVTPLQSLGVTVATLAARPAIGARLRKQLMHAVTISDSKPPTSTRAKARARKRARLASPAVTPDVAKTDAARTSPAPAKPTLIRKTFVPPKVNLGAVGRAHVQASFGTVTARFISSDKLGNAWADALRNSGLTQTSGMGAVHTAIKKIAATAVLAPHTLAPAFGNWVAATLPALYSTSGQGIVVGGDGAGDIRILNNTIDGSVQGIHIGLSDLKVHPHQPHILADRVQVIGNTIRIRLTAETTGDRHGIFVGCASSAVVSDNQVELTRYQNAGQDIYAIKIAGFFGQLLLLQRNSMVGFTAGLVTVPDATALPKGVLWKASDNASNSPNSITSFFTAADNIGA